MIVWLNGSFGAGKSTTASLLEQRLDDCRVFDPEHVGYMLSANFEDVQFSDFQELRPWRELVPLSLKSVRDFTNQTIIAPQTVLVESYWIEIRDSMQQLGLDLHHVVLDCGEDSLLTRIDGDETKGPSGWRHDHVPRYFEARPWLLASANTVIDTTSLMPAEVAGAVIDAVKLGYHEQPSPPRPEC